MSESNESGSSRSRTSEQTISCKRERTESLASESSPLKLKKLKSNGDNASNELLDSMDVAVNVLTEDIDLCKRALMTSTLFLLPLLKACDRKLSTLDTTPSSSDGSSYDDSKDMMEISDDTVELSRSHYAQKLENTIDPVDVGVDVVNFVKKLRTLEMQTLKSRSTVEHISDCAKLRYEQKLKDLEQLKCTNNIQRHAINSYIRGEHQIWNNGDITLTLRHRLESIPRNVLINSIRSWVQYMPCDFNSIENLQVLINDTDDILNGESNDNMDIIMNALVEGLERPSVLSETDKYNVYGRTYNPSLSGDLILKYLPDAINIDDNFIKEQLGIIQKRSSLAKESSDAITSLQSRMKEIKTIWGRLQEVVGKVKSDLDILK